MDICRAGPDWDWQSCPVYCSVNLCAQDLPEPVISYFVPPFLAATDDESIDIFCRLIFPCLCADFISPDRILFHIPFCCIRMFTMVAGVLLPDRILFHIPFCCSSENLRCAVDFEPYLSGMSAHLQPVVRTNNIPLIVFLSLHPGLPVFAGFGICDATVSH